jgi:hypothetical protein
VSAARSVGEIVVECAAQSGMMAGSAGTSVGAA